MAEMSASRDSSVTTSKEKPLFRDIAADDEDPEITEIESLCVSCEEQGVTRLFLTKIPFFREVIVSSFTCDHCGYHNAELEPSGKIQDKGVRYKVLIKDEKDLNRQVVQTKWATVMIPLLEFEAPPIKGVLSTVEGVIERAIDGLNQNQVLRRIQHPEVAAQIDQFVEKLVKLKSLEKPFELIVEDPSGNGFVENPRAPSRDPEMTIVHFTRTKEQDHQLGLYTSEELEDQPQGQTTEDAGKEEKFNPQDEVMQFQTNCPNCQSPCQTNMKLVNIPHFKEVVIMATSCEVCGHRENEVKGGSGIESMGVRISLNITKRDDMSRDVIKSDTCAILIPELDFETEMGTLGGKFTTVEGLLSNMKDQLKESNPFFRGDSSQPDVVKKLSNFCDKLDKIISGETMNIHFVLDDPAGNSYIENLYAPNKDPQMEITKYLRNFQQNEELGLNDMKTENYSES